MEIYKELSLLGKKEDFDEFKKNAPTLNTANWKYIDDQDPDNNYIAFEYSGDTVEDSTVYIYYGPDTWREREIKVVNIVPSKKDQLTINEYNMILDLFYTDIIKPYVDNHSSLRVNGPTSNIFNPLDYISKEALSLLTTFCNCANKSTGSTHPSDEKRWFDFICQTVEDKQTFDYDTIYRFLMDEEYWGEKKPGFVGAMGHFAWDERHAQELASEYDNYVRFLEFYKDREWKRKHEEAQQ